jgi:nitrogen fixation NifU-like protein
VREDLYQEAILARARAGQADSRLEPHDARAIVDNPLCGDRVTIDLRLDAGRVAALGQRTRGCALCQAAAETLREAAIGAGPADAEAGAAAVRAFLAGGAEPAARWSGFALFAPARGYPSRHGCVLLPFEALQRALAAGPSPS